MKHLILAAMFACWSAVCAGQKIRFTDTSNKWLQLHVLIDGNWIDTQPFTSQYDGDTIIAGQVYQKLDGVRFLPLAATIAFREDTAAGKVYYRLTSDRFTNRDDTLEHLFFDYNFKVGDTLYTNRLGDSFQHLVQQIDSVQLGALYQRRWRMLQIRKPSNPQPVSYDFIEGFGTPAGPAFSVSPYTFESGQQLRCFTNKGLQPVCSPKLSLPYCGANNLFNRQDVLPACLFDNAASCELKPLSIEANSNGKQVLCPNPVNGSTILTTSLTSKEIRLSIVNNVGQTVLHKIFPYTTNIPLGQYLNVPGIYTYLLQEGNGQRYTGRFVFQ